MFIGHKTQIDILKRLAQSNRLSHGYIFHGPPQIGKCLVAKELAHYLESGRWPDGHAAILSDVLMVSPGESGTIGIDAARKIKNFLWQKPIASQYRTVIIDEGDRLTNEAQNALLKITEEPPSYALLVVVTRDHELLWPTLASRLQKLYFSPVSENHIEQWLVASHKVSDTKARVFAKRSFGRPGLALAYTNDTNLTNIEAQAKSFLAIRGVSQRTFLKTLTQDDSFNVKEFLDALLRVLAAGKQKNPFLWHSLIELRKNVDIFNLNPRIQLMNVLASYHSKT